MCLICIEFSNERHSHIAGAELTRARIILLQGTGPVPFPNGPVEAVEEFTGIRVVSVFDLRL